MTEARARDIITIITAGLFVILLTAMLVLAPAASARAEALVAIDIGHSSARPGASSARGRPEFEFNLAFAQLLQQALAERQARSLLIGADGRMDDLGARAPLAARAGATLLVSVHHDSAQPRYLQPWTWLGRPHQFTDRFAGFSVFVSRRNPDPATSLACARAVGRSLQQAGRPVARHHAEDIPGENRPWADEAAGVYHFDDLVVLRSAGSAALLVELAVIVNPADELLAQDARHQQAWAQAIAAGLAACGALR
ncbi:MAG: hypothetical protein RLZZ584_3483 [Pseudomonadota bacterium]